MNKLPSFSVILVFVVLMIIGCGTIPMLNIQYTPNVQGSELSVNYSWPNASAKLVEMDVTSKLEGVIAAVNGVKKVSSISRKGGGNISIELKDKDNLESVRFEVSQLIRQIYKSLPSECSYPTLGGASAGASVKPILSFTINAELPTQDIENYAQEYIVKELALIKGVNEVILSGATPYFVSIVYDSKMLSKLGIASSEIGTAINSALAENKIVGSVNDVGVFLKSNADYNKLEELAIKSVEGRIIRLGDIAKIDKKEALPQRYYRINGLNTINITVVPEKFVNTLELTSVVKDKMASLEVNFPHNFAVIVSYDSSITLKEELNKILFRTILSLLILLIFVFVVSKSFRYLFIVTISLLANILIAFIFYVLLDLEIHLYSLAGITVSLGIIIDTSIIMISHYGYYKNRKVFIAILAAQLTSIGALIVVFLLPPAQKANLVDFCGVIIINLGISLLISMLLIPALVDTIGVKSNSISTKNSMRVKRFTIKFNNLYTKYIYYGKKYKWVTFLLLILGFGLPIDQLPDSLGSKASEYNKKEDDTFGIKVYNATLGSDFFVDKIKEPAGLALGGALRLFYSSPSYGNFYREPGRPTLNIRASLPDGCTIAQLNEIMLDMENYLAQFSEIESFKTSIYSFSNGFIEVLFNKDIENGPFPAYLQQMVTEKAINFGGANWSVYGILERGFNNNISTGYKSERIKFTGYNYDELYKYCQIAIENLSKSPRVNEPAIFGSVGWGNSISRSEYFIDYDPTALATYGLSNVDAYLALREQLYSTIVASYHNESGNKLNVNVTSDRKENFDVWNLANEYINIGDKNLRFASIGTIDKRNSGNDIYRDNQQYTLYVAYDFVGSGVLANRIKKREVERLNNEVLPVGYSAKIDGWGNWNSSSSSYWMLFIIIGVIFFVCAILFESLLYPLIIIGLIPISFIGVFLIFYITDCYFDQGGYASLVMLSGIVVNAGIYILNELNMQRGIKRYGGVQLLNGDATSYATSGATVSDAITSSAIALTGLKYYIRAYNHKIVPILLTVLSTLLGLIPFLLDGKEDVFWYAFALGTIGGLLFSLIALVLFMPIWVPMNKK